MKNLLIILMLSMSLLITSCTTGNENSTTSDAATTTAITAPTTSDLETITTQRLNLLPTDSKNILTLTTATNSIAVSSYSINNDDHIITFRCPCGLTGSIASPYTLTKSDGTIVVHQGDISIPTTDGTTISTPITVTAKRSTTSTH